MSLGLDRICLEMDAMNLFPDDLQNRLDVLFVNFGKEEARHAQLCISKIRKNGISSELFPSNIKLNKQMSYANKRAVKYVVMLGEEELKKNILTVRNMDSGVQQSLSLEEFINSINSHEK